LQNLHPAQADNGPQGPVPKGGRGKSDDTVVPLTTQALHAHNEHAPIQGAMAQPAAVDFDAVRRELAHALEQQRANLAREAEES
jgi:hypothetical protein